MKILPSKDMIVPTAIIVIGVLVLAQFLPIVPNLKKAPA